MMRKLSECYMFARAAILTFHILVAETTEIYFLTFLDDGKFQIKVSADSFLVKAFFLAYR